MTPKFELDHLRSGKLSHLFGWLSPDPTLNRSQRVNTGRLIKLKNALDKPQNSLTFDQYL
jgi:hypothetical protein